MFGEMGEHAHQMIQQLGNTGAAPMLDRYLDQPPYSQPHESARENFEHTLAHALIRGEIQIEHVTQHLDEYDAWVSAGEPKLTTIEGPTIFDIPRPLE